MVVEEGITSDASEPSLESRVRGLSVILVLAFTYVALDSTAKIPEEFTFYFLYPLWKNQVRIANIPHGSSFVQLSGER